MKLITFNLPELYLKKLGELVNLRYFPNLAEALREGTRTIIKEHVDYGHIKRPLYKETPADKNPFNQSLENLFIL